MKKQALISCSDKSGVVEFAKELSNLGYHILSTGGTAKLIAEAGIPVQEVAGLPERGGWQAGDRPGGGGDGAEDLPPLSGRV